MTNTGSLVHLLTIFERYPDKHYVFVRHHFQNGLAFNGIIARKFLERAYRGRDGIPSHIKSFADTELVSASRIGMAEEDFARFRTVNKLPAEDSIPEAKDNGGLE